MDKSVYRQIREELKLSREKASDIMPGIPPERLERIENGKFEPTPWEVNEMAKAYNKPELRNYYCANRCELGINRVQNVEMKDISQIVLEIINSLNTINTTKDRLVQITVDGKIDDDEIEDFVKIEKQLDDISKTVSSMQLWVEKMINSGKINKEKYEEKRG
ncbi:MAG: helix-turn-helix transcriptional regulator [Clostridia bacterium]|nr:helix-turn-helix transcriptional regulator [Clostridia bacterium]